MFTNYEKKLLGDDYFTIIREEEKFIELKSKNTGHCWLIFKQTYNKDTVRGERSRWRDIRRIC